MPIDSGPVLKPANGGVDGGMAEQHRSGPAASVDSSAVRPEVIEVDFRSGETRGPRPRPYGLSGKPAVGLAAAWIVNLLAALVALIWGQDINGPGAVPFFIIGTLAGLAADGSARLLARGPLRRRVHKATLNDELLTGSAIVFLFISITFAIFGCVVVSNGLI